MLLPVIRIFPLSEHILYGFFITVFTDDVGSLFGSIVKFDLFQYSLSKYSCKLSLGT